MNVLRKLSAIVFLVCLSLNVNAQQVQLPKGMTEYEKTIMEDYLQTFNDRGITTPPPYTNIRNMAEWEESEALVITWTGGFNSIQAQIVDAAQDECIVIIHCTDSNNVKSTLSGYGVPDVNIEYIEVAYNSIWIRDYFANTCYSNYVEDRFFVDWIYNRPRPDDDLISEATAAYMGIDIYSMTANPTRFMATGGNWMTDGAGNAFSSELILDENDGTGDNGLSYPNHTENDIDQMMNDWMGINTYIKMTVLPYDDIHHIDMHMKLLDEETLLVGEYPAGVSDGPQIEANLQYVLSNFTTKFGTPFKVYRIPQPSSVGGGYPGSGGYYRTYANQTMVNNTILLPTYRAEYDTIALGILDTILPGYNIVPIDVDNSGQNLISLSGAIHCITHTVGVENPVYISHKKLENTTDVLNPYQADATIMHINGIQAASIWYKTDIAGTYTAVPMINTSGDTWSGLIPAQPAGTTVYYYVEGTAVGGKQLTHPFPAPAGYHKFKVSGSGGGSGIDEVNPLGMNDIYPNPASAITVIPVHTNRTIKNARIILTNMVGQIVEVIYEGELPQGDKNFFFDASQYAAGMYQVMIQSEEYKVYQKVVIK
ncbi:MAG: agmatine deiminase family protein [Crocinitomicaceae bacterium]|nr:agmatine deiminase family protein [Crocinitomicaceae bacterium]